ncbi:aspartic proteinase [Colletotrichum paranaense]|nr:aspartic proteinase [Colletotrichum paranaense]KAK1528262.1 aspartic proteinase [Colletotrichum paranaense]
MSAAKKVAVIATSTRTPRIGTKVAELVKDTITTDATTNGIDLNLVEVSSFRLPVFDEQIIPAQVPAAGDFAHEHSKAWSMEIAKYDAYIIVVPEYNYGLPGGTKNAIDYLYNEWIGKPIAVVSYGIMGGNSASAQAQKTLEGMKLRVAPTRPALAFAGGAGPDLVAAMGHGEIGEESRKKWEGESESILKAFDTVPLGSALAGNSRRIGSQFDPLSPFAFCSPFSLLFHHAPFIAVIRFLSFIVMRTSALFALSGCAATALAQVHLPFSHRPQPKASSNVETRDVADRRSVSAMDVYVTDWNYLVNATVGTPPQDISLRVSVQAEHTWVPNAKYCDYYNYSDYYDSSSTRSAYYLDSYSCKYGAFQSNESSTYVNPGTEDFSTRYSVGRAKGEWISDTLGVAGSQISKMIMGYVQSADVLIGVLGLGFNTTGSAQSTASPSSTSNYPTVPERLVQDGLISSPAYSLWLDDSSATSGNLLLGAIDTSKFEGPLLRFSVRTTGSWSTSRRFDTFITSFNGSKSDTDDLQPLGESLRQQTDAYDTSDLVLLSPDAALSVLPDDIALDLWALAGASWNDDLGYAIIACTENTTTGRLAVQLYGSEGPVLNVALADLVVSQDVWSHSEWSWETESASEYCLFGVQSENSTSTYTSSSYPYSLGNTFLKHSYMVFDLINEEIGFAKTKFSSTQTENLVPFSSLGAQIPASTSVMPDWCSSTSSQCRTGDSGSGSGGGSYGGGTTYLGDGYYPGHLPLEANLAIGLSVGVFCTMVMGLSIWAIRRGRRIRKAQKELAEKQADVEPGGETQVGAADGNAVNLAQEALRPQHPPAAVARDPSVTDADAEQRATGIVGTAK